jgi:hypothetical protein
MAAYSCTNFERFTKRFAFDAPDHDRGTMLSEVVSIWATGWPPNQTYSHSTAGVALVVSWV